MIKNVPLFGTTPTGEPMPLYVLGVTWEDANRLARWGKVASFRYVLNVHALAGASRGVLVVTPLAHKRSDYEDVVAYAQTREFRVLAESEFRQHTWR